MRIFHDSHNLKYRSPFGAVPAGSILRLSIDVETETEPNGVYLRIWRSDKEYLYPMTQGDKTNDSYFYTVSIKIPEKPALLWYYFIVQENEGEEIYYANNSKLLGGVGEITEAPDERSYQVTVYDGRYKTPDWFKNSIMYQIFPDRFYGDHSATDGKIWAKRPEYVIHDDWYAPISFNNHPHEFGPACNDFYGGNLKGIIQKLPYLHDLGVSVIYLNPIFDAYSNHKYDTANYKEIDPMFGTTEDFEELCKKAKGLGIRIILDGVFSHTGADSIYFNKYGYYGENEGAYRDPNSPYRSWFQFTDYPNYNSWWGCSNLPNVNELEPSYMNYILRDDNSVVKKWIKLGASGWRIDVADELPDEFIKELRKQVKKTDKEAVIIGEVWEDASNKEAYGEKREYLYGDELDSVMNYPFKDNMIHFIMGMIDADEMNKKMMSIMENYPKETLYSLMNIAGTHDTMRIKTVFGGLASDCGTQRLTSAQEEIAAYRQKIMSMIQMTYIGVPCIYYGDEVGMQGGSDPFNRGTYPWRSVDPELRLWYKNLADFRNSHVCLRMGNYKCLYAKGGIYVYARYISGGYDAFDRRAKDDVIICAVNRDMEPAEVKIDLSDFAKNELRGHKFYALEQILEDPKRMRIVNNLLNLNIPALGAQIFVE